MSMAGWIGEDAAKNAQKSATASKFPQTLVQGPPSWRAADSPTMTTVARNATAPTATQALASRAPTYTANTYTPGISSYAIGNAPQVSTNPLNNVPTQFIPSFETPLAAVTEFAGMGGSAPQAARVNIMGHAQAAMDMLDYAGQERVAAARESEIARGMGRSGVALGVEDRVNYETDLAKAAEYAEYSARQAEIDTQISMANVQAQTSFQQLQEQSRQYAAALQQERALANQQAQIEMSGLQTQWASQLADIAYQREALNANMKQTQEQMLRSANEFDRSLEAENFFRNEQNRLGFSTLSEDARQANMGNDYNYANLAAQTRQWEQENQLAQQNLMAQTQQAGTDWMDVTNNSVDYFQNAASESDPYADTRAYLNAVSPGWESNEALSQLWTAPASTVYPQTFRTTHY